MPFTRRTALTVAGLGAITTAALASYAVWRSRDLTPMKDEQKIRRDREFDWGKWLGEWDSDARLAVAKMLVRFGVTGPETTGLKDYFRKQALEAGHALPEEILSPLGSPGELDLDAAGQLMRDARERIAELLQYVSYSIDDYAWLVIRNGGVSFPPATTAEFDSVQARLGVQFPHAFSQFLRVSNGWLSLLARIVPIGQTARFGEKDPEYVAIWSEGRDDISDDQYFVYGVERQSTPHYRSRYLKDCLLISAPVLEPNNRVLLNPAVRFADGEWETWFMAPWLAGAVRYQSFIEVMEQLRREDTEHFRYLTGEKTPPRAQPPGV
jgi:hypothetical protein